MYIVIVGDTLFAVEIAKHLKRRKEHKIVMLIKDKDRAMEISSEEETIVVTGSALDIKTLEDLKLDTCDVFISATSIEEVNILSALYAREANVKRIFVKTDNPETELILRRMGINAINPEFYSAAYIENKITNPIANGLVGIHTHTQRPFELVEYSLKKGSTLVGSTVTQIVSDFFSAIAFFKNDTFGTGESPIPEEAVLLILCKYDRVKDLDKGIRDLEKSIKKKL